MLNLFGSISSLTYQFLVLESPLIQVIFMKKHAKNPLFEGLCYNLKGLELFSQMNFESSWVFEGLKIFSSPFNIRKFCHTYLDLWSYDIHSTLPYRDPSKWKMSAKLEMTKTSVICMFLALYSRIKYRNWPKKRVRDTKDL